MALQAKDFEMVIEVRGVYDGWSVGVRKDGTLVNRWSALQYPERARATQKWIDARGGRMNIGEDEGA